MPVSTLFLAAIIPGILVMLAMMITNVVLNRMYGFEKGHKRFLLQNWLSALWDARWALFVPIVILGGIYSGIFTPTEAASIAVVVVVLVGFQQGTLRLVISPGC